MCFVLVSSSSVVSVRSLARSTDQQRSHAQLQSHQPSHQPNVIAHDKSDRGVVTCVIKPRHFDFYQTDHYISITSLSLYSVPFTSLFLCTLLSFCPLPLPLPIPLPIPLPLSLTLPIPLYTPPPLSLSLFFSLSLSLSLFLSISLSLFFSCTPPSLVSSLLSSIPLYLSISSSLTCSPACSPPLSLIHSFFPTLKDTHIPLLFPRPI